MWCVATAVGKHTEVARSPVMAAVSKFVVLSLMASAPLSSGSADQLHLQFESVDARKTWLDALLALYLTHSPRVVHDS